MIYLAHPDGQRAVCECDRTAAMREAQGFVRCTYELHRALWRREVRRWQKAQQPVLETAPLARAVGGWTRYDADGKEIT